MKAEDSNEMPAQIMPSSSLDSSSRAFPCQLPAGLVIVDGESGDEFEEFRRRLEAQFSARSVMAAFLVAHLTSILWRLRRSARFEAGLLSWVAHQQVAAHDQSGIAVGDHFFPGDRRALPRRPTTGNQRVRKKHERELIGRTLEAAFSRADILGRMGRYEAHLMRQAERVIAELRRLEPNALSTCQQASRRDAGRE